MASVPLSSVEYIDSDPTDGELDRLPVSSAPEMARAADLLSSSVEAAEMADPYIEPAGPEVPLCPVPRPVTPQLEHGSVVRLRSRTEINGK